MAGTVLAGNAPIYNLKSEMVRANGNGAIDHPILLPVRYNQNGIDSGNLLVWTGVGPTTGYINVNAWWLGAADTDSTVGQSWSSSKTWITSYPGQQIDTSQSSVYGMSDVLTVPVPEPATIVLWSLFTGVAGLVFWQTPLEQVSCASTLLQLDKARAESTSHVPRSFLATRQSCSSCSSRLPSRIVPQPVYTGPRGEPAWTRIEVVDPQSGIDSVGVLACTRSLPYSVCSDRSTLLSHRGHRSSRLSRSCSSCGSSTRRTTTTRRRCSRRARSTRRVSAAAARFARSISPTAATIRRCWRCRRAWPATSTSASTASGCSSRCAATRRTTTTSTRSTPTAAGCGN